MWNRFVCIFSCLKKYTRAKFLLLPSPAEINRTALKLRSICNFVYFSKHTVKRINSGVTSNLVQILVHPGSIPLNLSDFHNSFPLRLTWALYLQKRDNTSALQKFGRHLWNTFMPLSVYCLENNTKFLWLDFLCQKYFLSSHRKGSPTPSQGSCLDTSVTVSWSAAPRWIYVYVILSASPILLSLLETLPSPLSQRSNTHLSKTNWICIRVFARPLRNMVTYHNVGPLQPNWTTFNYDYSVFPSLSPVTSHFYGRLLFVLLKGEIFARI